MKCLRCGHCCIYYDVMIVVNSALGIVDGNIMYKPAGERCPHLKGDAPGVYSCEVHEEAWYKDTPCFSYDQLGPEGDCRLGSYKLSHKINDFVKMRKCRTCGHEYPECDLLYDGVEPDIDMDKGQCRACMIKDAQDRYGKDNVLLPYQNQN